LRERHQTFFQTFQLISALTLEPTFKQENLKELSDVARKMDDLDKRVSSLKKLKAWGLGAAVAIGFVAAALSEESWLKCASGTPSVTG
jgi:hypothetical protein